VRFRGFYIGIYRSLSKHLRDVDKVEGIWRERKVKDRTRSKKRQSIAKENLFLNR